MNEHELTTLLERAGDRLSPDVDHLVAGGAARGRRSLRRRRLTSGLGAVAAVGVIATGVSLWPTAEAPTVADDPGFAAAPAAGDRELADPEVIKDRLVAALPDGEVTGVKLNHSDEQGEMAYVRFQVDAIDVIASVHIREAAVDVPEPGPEPDSCDDYRDVIDSADDPVNGLAQVRPGPDSWPVGTSPGKTGDPAADAEFKAWSSCYVWYIDVDRYECAQDAECWDERQTHPCITETNPKIACTEQEDGTWIRSYTLSSYEDDPARAGPSIHVGVQFVTAEGWGIDLQIEEPNTEASPTAEPTIPEADWIALAESDIWFE